MFDSVLKENFSTYNILAAVYLMLSFSFCYLLIQAQSISLFEKLSEYSVHFAVSFLIIGMIFFLLSKRVFVFISFAACGILAGFLKTESKQSLIKPDNTQDMLFILHLDGRVMDDTISILQEIKIKNPDILSIHHLDSTLFLSLQHHLSSNYPALENAVYCNPLLIINSNRQNDDGSDGCILHKLSEAYCIIQDQKNEDPFVYAQSSLIFDNKYIEVISFQDESSPISKKTPPSRTYHCISDLIQKMDAEKIIIGDFQSVHWSASVRHFRQSNKLEVNREILSDGLEKPGYVHVLYSQELQAVCFKELYHANTNVGNHTCIQVRRPKEISAAKNLMYE